jgi:uncharacterized protein YjbI with pentapeptide repeats
VKRQESTPNQAEQHASSVESASQDDAEQLRLAQRIEELETELSSLQRGLERERAMRHGARRASTYVLAQVALGPSLINALRAWFQVTLEEHRLPVDETAHVIAAVIRRVLRVAMVGLAVTLLPTSILLWQNLIMKEQNAYMRVQNQSLREQIELERAESQAARRAELFRLLFAVSDCRQGVADPNCPPSSPERVRVEALMALAQLAHGRAEALDLSGLRLPGASLEEVDLSGFVLRDARLDDAVLSNAVLDEAILDGAQMERAILVDASLNGSSWFDVEAPQVVLSGSKLHEAKLTESRLSGASLGRALADGARFQNCELDQSEWLAASLVEAQFEGCALRQADFSQAQLRNTRFVDSDLSAARFDGAWVEAEDWLQQTAADNRGFEPSRWRLEQVGSLYRVLSASSDTRVAP